MVPEAPLERTETGWLRPVSDGWFVLNARDARWGVSEGRGTFCSFEGEPEFSQLGIHLASDPRNDVRHRFHICLSGMKVDNAGAKHVVAADYGVGHECFTSALQPIDQLPVERIEMKFNL